MKINNLFLEIKKIDIHETVTLEQDVAQSLKIMSKDIGVPQSVLLTNIVHEYLRRYNYDTYLFANEDVIKDDH
jgi:hypothetical protein